MTIEELLARREPVVNLLAPDRRVSEAVRIMAQRRVGAVLVVEEERLVGIFTERDVVCRVLDKGGVPADIRLGSVMTSDPVTAEAGEDVHQALSKMQEADCRHLPVLVEGHVADTLSMRDLLFSQLVEREREVEQLHSYIRGEPSS